MRRRAAQQSREWQENAQSLFSRCASIIAGSAPSPALLRAHGIEPASTAAERKLQLILEKTLTVVTAGQVLGGWSSSPTSIALVTGDDIAVARGEEGAAGRDGDGYEEDDAAPEQEEVVWVFVERRPPEGSTQQIVEPSYKTVLLEIGETLKMPEEVVDRGIERAGSANVLARWRAAGAPLASGGNRNAT